MLPIFRWHVGFGGVHMKCQNLLWANLSQQNLNLGDVQPKKKAGIKAAVSWLNVYLRCLACQNSVVCCLKNEASKKKWRRKWRVKLMHLCIQSIAVLGVDGLQPRNMVGVSWKKSNNPASLISNCLFWAYPGRLWKVSFHMLKNVCSCSFLDTSYFANSWNTECTQGLGVFFLWHFSAILIWMESCRSAIVERRDTRMKPAAKTLKFTCPPATQSCHPLTPICHLNPPGVLHTLLEKKVTKVGWIDFLFQWKILWLSFLMVVFLLMLYAASWEKLRWIQVFRYQTLGKTKADYHPTFHQGSTGWYKHVWAWLQQTTPFLPSLNSFNFGNSGGIPRWLEYERFLTVFVA